jgi:hypothetical protein
MVLAAQVGCGGGKTGPAATAELTEDQQQIMSLVGGVSDSATELNRLRESFTKAAAPKEADRKRFSENRFEVSGPINVTGSSASFTVKMGLYTSENSVEKTWKATKEGKKWLLSEAPLP